MKQPRLSVIVPVYNVVQHLRHCLQSLAEQGMPDYEVILVNDASRDNSRGICAEWCESHPQFRLINHDTNRGLSEARNTGIREARGRFLTFVDSDDFLAPDTLSQVMASMDEEADVVEYPVMQHHFSKQPHRLSFRPQTVTFAAWMQQGGAEHCYAWNKIFRASLWQGEKFPPGVHYEDIFCVPYILRKARAIQLTDKGLYYYCERPGSISRTPAPASLRQYAESLERLMQLPESQGNDLLVLRARNAERSYQQCAHNRERIISRRHVSAGFWLSAGLTWRERLKALYYVCF